MWTRGKWYLKCETEIFHHVKWESVQEIYIFKSENLYNLKWYVSTELQYLESEKFSKF